MKIRGCEILFGGLKKVKCMKNVHHFPKNTPTGYVYKYAFFISNPTFENHSKLLATREPKIGNS
jgi:hypothetical protein